MYPPRHGPQVGVETMQPASINASAQPRRMHSLYTAMVPGMMMPRTPLAIFLPRSSCQAASISSRRPLVQLPITTWSTGMRCAWASAAVWVFSGRWG